MKRIIVILAISMISGVSLQAKEIFSMKDLRPGDFVHLQIGIPLVSADRWDPWLFEHVENIDLILEVLSPGADSIRFAVKPVRWLFCYRNDDRRRLAKRETSAYVYYYFNSDLTAFYDEHPLFYLFDDNAVTAAVGMKDGGANIVFSNSADVAHPSRSAKQWYIQLVDIPKGLKTPPFDSAIPDYSLNFERVADFVVNAFFQAWNANIKSGNPIPQTVDLRSFPEKFDGKPSSLTLVSASFGIRPNTHISFAPSPVMPGDRVFIQMDGKSIKPSRSENGVYEFNLFLSSPKRATIGELILDLTPGDSLQVSFGVPENKYRFNGKGAANSAYSNAAAIIFSGNFSNVEDEDALEEFTAEKELARQSLLAEYKDGMNEYWLKSATLSFDYWYASQCFKLYNQLFQKNWRGHKQSVTYQIPWYDERIMNLAPYSDYLYRPSTYDAFLDEYYIYTAWSVNSSILTGFKYLQFGVSQYYFADAVFWGYPRFYLTGKTLKELMQRFSLRDHDREYQDFLEKCNMPELCRPIMELHDQLLKMNETTIRAIIVEDERNNRENLENMLRENCPVVEIVAVCSSALEGLKKIASLQPDLMFLDVEMPGGDGFSLLENVPQLNFEVIFVTAFANYALKAIKFSALDYIVKPIDVMELLKAVGKAVRKICEKTDNSRMVNLLENQHRPSEQKVLALPLSDKIEFVEVSQIVRCQSDGNYTVFFLKNGEKLLISKTLKEYDELLSPFHFLRVHQSHLINLREVKSFVKTDGGYILMKDGASITISRQRREMVLKILKGK